MKKLILFLIVLCGAVSLHAQRTEPMNINLSPDGLLDNVVDHYGNTYKLSDIMIEPVKMSKTGTALSTSTTPVTAGYFNLYFEAGSGMDNSANATEMARRAVVVKVFSDLSAFINSPLTTTGNKVNIWVRKYSEVSNTGPLGLADSFECTPFNTTAGFGGISDNEIWKTIHTGVDSFTNVRAPLSNIPGTFYHGMLTVNFNNVTETDAVFHTNLSANCPSTLFDLYTFVLHEVTHALGFGSSISDTGIPRHPAGFNYYSRYDKFLKNNAGTQSLITTTNLCSMYNYGFNAGLNTSILHPSSSCITDQTTCGSAIKYVSSSLTMPVYTPNCYEAGSSLSHFEDQCFAPNVNNAYFLMDNVMSRGTNKRYPKIEERQALCDLGYSVKTSFGSTAFNGTISYAGTTVCGGITVAGVNDGLDSNGVYKFTSNPGVSVQINGGAAGSILSNDYGATTFEGLEDVFSPATFSGTSGNASTVINYSSTVPGTHLLRYVPINDAGQRGNITYLYVYINESSTCTVSPSSCDLVTNGNFETFSSLPSGLSSSNEISKACGWSRVNNTTPDYYNAGSTIANSDVPCNYWGGQASNGTGNGYAGLIFWDRDNGNFLSENMVIKLASPLLPNTTYQLSFDASLIEGMSQYVNKLQAYLSVDLLPVSAANGNLAITNPNRLYTSPTYLRNVNGWDTVRFSITTGDTAGEQYLYLGRIQNVGALPNTPPATTSGCTSYYTEPTTISNYHFSGYYIDNVSLIPSLNAALNLPASICNNQALSNLSTYLSASTPTGGTFAGNGVTVSNGIYSFNAATAGIGFTTITYNYSSGGCSISLSGTIEVIDCTSTTVCPPDLPFTSTQAATTASYQAANTIVANGNYLVNSGTTITMQAGYSITFSPSSEIKAGSTFIAKIAPCTPSARKNDVDAPTVVESITIYPNPTNDLVTISTNGEDIKTITIVAIDGKLIANQNIGKGSSCQFNMGNYQHGIYILTVETASGTVFREKIVKN